MQEKSQQEASNPSVSSLDRRQFLSTLAFMSASMPALVRTLCADPNIQLSDSTWNRAAYLGATSRDIPDTERAYKTLSAYIGILAHADAIEESFYQGKDLYAVYKEFAPKICAPGEVLEKKRFELLCKKLFPSEPLDFLKSSFAEFNVGAGIAKIVTGASSPMLTTAGALAVPLLDDAKLRNEADYAQVVSRELLMADTNRITQWAAEGYYTLINDPKYHQVNSFVKAFSSGALGKPNAESEGISQWRINGDVESSPRNNPDRPLIIEPLPALRQKRFERLTDAAVDEPPIATSPASTSSSTNDHRSEAGAFDLPHNGHHNTPVTPQRDPSHILPQNQLPPDVEVKRCELILLSAQTYIKNSFREQVTLANDMRKFEYRHNEIDGAISIVAGLSQFTSDGPSIEIVQALSLAHQAMKLGELTSNAKLARGLGMGPLSLASGYLGIALGLASMFGLGGKSESQIILEAVQKVSDQIGDLQRITIDGFRLIDAQQRQIIGMLDQCYKAIIESREDSAARVNELSEQLEAVGRFIRESKRADLGVELNELLSDTWSALETFQRTRVWAPPENFETRLWSSAILKSASPAVTSLPSESAAEIVSSYREALDTVGGLSSAFGSAPLLLERLGITLPPLERINLPLDQDGRHQAYRIRNPHLWQTLADTWSSAMLAHQLNHPGQRLTNEQSRHLENLSAVGVNIKRVSDVLSSDEAIFRGWKKVQHSIGQLKTSIDEKLSTDRAQEIKPDGKTMGILNARITTGQYIDEHFYYFKEDHFEHAKNAGILTVASSNWQEIGDAGEIYSMMRPRTLFAKISMATLSVTIAEGYEEFFDGKRFFNLFLYRMISNGALLNAVTINIPMRGPLTNKMRAMTGNDLLPLINNDPQYVTSVRYKDTYCQLGSLQNLFDGCAKALVATPKRQYARMLPALGQRLSPAVSVGKEKEEFIANTITFRTALALRGWAEFKNHLVGEEIFRSAAGYLGYFHKAAAIEPSEHNSADSQESKPSFQVEGSLEAILQSLVRGVNRHTLRLFESAIEEHYGEKRSAAIIKNLHSALTHFAATHLSEKMPPERSVPINTDRPQKQSVLPSHQPSEEAAKILELANLLPSGEEMPSEVWEKVTGEAWNNVYADFTAALDKAKNEKIEFPYYALSEVPWTGLSARFDIEHLVPLVIKKYLEREATLCVSEKLRTVEDRLKEGFTRSELDALQATLHPQAYARLSGYFEHKDPTYRLPLAEIEWERIEGTLEDLQIALALPKLHKEEHATRSLPEIESAMLRLLGFSAIYDRT